MCRFVYYQGDPIRIADLLTEPEHSLIHQSVHAKERSEPLNGDGFGVGWFAEGDDVPALFRSTSPAWSNCNLREIARITSSRRILAHVRAATQGSRVSEANCHPFRMAGLAFMHNGNLGGFPQYRRQLMEGLSDEAFSAIRGTTDSEHFFALLWDEWNRTSGQSVSEDPDSDDGVRLADALEGALARTLELWRASGTPSQIYLNCLVTDGRDAVGCRFTSDDPDRADTLYLQHGRRYTVEEGQAVTLPGTGHHESVLLSSEPLTPDEAWHAVPVGSLLLISNHGRIRTREISVA